VSKANGRAEGSNKTGHGTENMAMDGAEGTEECQGENRRQCLRQRAKVSANGSG
jgi:hypothetical protein